MIIGGGICGASALYHLAHKGWTDTLLVEKAELTTGSTWHAARQVTHSVSSYALAEFHVRKGLAFAYLAPEHAEPGTTLEVRVVGEMRPARVLGEAVHDPSNTRLRA